MQTLWMDKNRRKDYVFSRYHWVAKYQNFDTNLYPRLWSLSTLGGYFVQLLVLFGRFHCMVIISNTASLTYIIYCHSVNAFTTWRLNSALTVSFLSSWHVQSPPWIQQCWHVSTFSFYIPKDAFKTCMYSTGSTIAIIGFTTQGGGHYIVVCTPTRNCGQDLDPSIFALDPLTAPKIWS